jgi:hypothetical protein
MTADDHRCEAVVGDDGTVLGHALVSPDLGERGRAALVEIAKAAIRLQAERDEADPVGAAERARRQEAGRARIAERMRRYRGEAK